VDDQGTSIDGTFWREAADKYHDLLQEGQVYVFSRGSVKPANKKFSQASLGVSICLFVCLLVSPGGKYSVVLLFWMLP
jgi:hypothetical protein